MQENNEQKILVKMARHALALKVKSMPEDEAVEILKDYVVKHKNEINFDQLAAFNKAMLILQGKKEFLSEEVINGWTDKEY